MEEEKLDEMQDNEPIDEVPELPDYPKEICELIQTQSDKSKLSYILEDYHDNDIAMALPMLTPLERKKLYASISAERVSDIFTYIEDANEYLAEFSDDKVADIIENMDADDAIDTLEQLPEDKKQDIISLLDEEAVQDVKLISAYDEEQIGSKMTNDYIAIPDNLSVKQAMRQVIEGASENENISTIYVYNSEGKFSGSINLRDLVIARSFTPLKDLIIDSYPYVYATDLVEDKLEDLKDYAEDSFPVLDGENKIIGVITADDIVEEIDDQMGDDIAKLSGLTEEVDDDERLGKSIKKRIPWLIILLIIDIFIGAYSGIFQGVVVAHTFLVFYTSLILDMSGNAGTQSLAVTIRALADKIEPRDKRKLIFKELLTGLCNGLVLGAMCVIVVTLYAFLAHKTDTGTFLQAFQTGASVGLAMLASLTVSSCTGTAIPVFFDKIGVDPAVASGPFITTLNDLIAVTVYYGTAILLFL